MKKNIIKVAFVAAFAIVAGYNVYNSQKTDKMSDLAMENIEALARREMDAGTCWGAGPNMSNVTCYGGYKICCWAHTDVFGKN
mgnify:CR=1 FL=1